MSVTRANVEAILVKRIGPLFNDLSLDGSTIDGTNADLNDPIAWALLRLGYSVTDLTDVSDTDLSATSSDNYNPLIDLAEYRALETAYNAAAYLVNITVGPRSEQMSQIAAAIDKMLARKKQTIEDDYGIGRGAVTTSRLELDFARHGDDDIYS